jgi:hypothetical protein
MSLEVDPFMHIVESVWPTMIGSGWWLPVAGATVAIDDFGRALPAQARFPSASPSVGLGPLCAALQSMRSADGSAGLRCGVDLVLGVPRAAVATASPVLGAAMDAAAVANRSDPIGAHHFGLNVSSPGAVPYGEKEIGGSGGSLEPPGSLLTHLHTV